MKKSQKDLQVEHADVEKSTSDPQSDVISTGTSSSSIIPDQPTLNENLQTIPKVNENQEETHLPLDGPINLSDLSMNYYETPHLPFDERKTKSESLDMVYIYHSSMCNDLFTTQFFAS